MYTNPLYGIINQKYVQEQLQRQQAQGYTNYQYNSVRFIC